MQTGFLSILHTVRPRGTAVFHLSAYAKQQQHICKTYNEEYYFIIENRDMEVYAIAVAMVTVMYVIFFQLSFSCYTV